MPTRLLNAFERWRSHRDSKSLPWYEHSYFVLDMETTGLDPRTGDRIVEIGGVAIEARHLGPAHSPGDIVIWLPQKGLVISGDMAFHERMLPIFPDTCTSCWLETWDTAFEPLGAVYVIPGHGHPTNMAQVKRYTYDYLSDLRAKIGDHLDNGGDLVNQRHARQRGRQRARRQFAGTDPVTPGDGHPGLHIAHAALLLAAAHPHGDPAPGLLAAARHEHFRGHAGRQVGARCPDLHGDAVAEPAGPFQQKGAHRADRRRFGRVRRRLAGSGHGRRHGEQRQRYDEPCNVMEQGAWHRAPRGNGFFQSGPYSR